MANTLAAKRGVAPSQLSDELTMPASMSLQMSAEPVANKSQCVLTPAESGGMSIHMALLYGLGICFLHSFSGTILAIVWVGTFPEFIPTTTHTPSCKGSTCGCFTAFCIQSRNFEISAHILGPSDLQSALLRLLTTPVNLPPQISGSPPYNLSQWLPLERVTQVAFWYSAGTLFVHSS
uniref:Uncharacterized protein n=1 Tax=Glossina palpalis gambiensis TaxID=67801 RepID=A0A1B0BAG6_9MUSC